MRLAKGLVKEQERLHSEPRYLSLDLEQKADVERMVLASPWLADWLRQQDHWPDTLTFFYQDNVQLDDIEHQVEHWRIDDEPLVMRDLRVWRNRHMARFMARDILKLNNVQQTAQSVSDLADIALKNALDWSMAYWQAKDGRPALCPFSNTPQQLIVIAMGKHGAQELNLSSDIDLIFAFPQAGQTENGLTHEEFFIRVGRKLIQLLDSRTAEGFVFRVDMRLRPWGQSGALVSNFKALQRYYLQQGRFWERFAMVKARLVTGSAEAQQALYDILQPFVYRRYVDFQAVGALRELKSKIQTEVRRQNLDRNIKLGAGGIREVEFIAQVFQLIRGGQDEELQARGTWPILDSLKTLELLPADVVDELNESYLYLRDLEHRIQAIRDEQTQVMPIDEIDLQRLVISTESDDVESLLAQLESVRSRVNHHFSFLISDQEEPQQLEKLKCYTQAWVDHDVSSELDESLSGPS